MPSVSFIAFLLVLGILFPIPGHSRTRRAPPKTFCELHATDPTTVNTFYETNPTYRKRGVESWPSDTPESQGLSSKALSLGAKKLETLPQAFSFLVIRNGVLVHEKYFHGSLASHSNNVHSASKSILGALVGIAIREGYLKNLEQTVGELLSPKFAIEGEKKKIKLRHLLSMSAGLRWTEDDTEYKIEDNASWIQSILNLAQKNEAGSTFNYSTGFTHLLSSILTESTGMSTCDFAQKFLFAPLNVQFAHWGRDPQGYYSGGFNLYLTPRELAKFGQLYLQRGNWNGNAVVPQNWVDQSLTAKQSVDATYDYGYLFWLLKINDRPVYKMWGYGGQFVYLVPSLNLVTILTADTKKDRPELDGDDFMANYVLPRRHK